MGLPGPVQRRLAGRPVVVDGQVLDAQTQWMLRLQQWVREPAVETLPMEKAREGLRRQSMLVGGRQPVGEVRELTVPGADGPIAARLRAALAGRRRRGRGGRGDGAVAAGSPLLFFIHGGGMMYGGLDSHDALCRFLAEQADLRVLSVDYRLAPSIRSRPRSRTAGRRTSGSARTRRPSAWTRSGSRSAATRPAGTSAR